MTWSPEERVQHIEEAMEEVDYHLYHVLEGGSGMGNWAYHLVELSNAMGALKTWHRGYDSDTGTLPWEREAE